MTKYQYLSIHVLTIAIGNDTTFDDVLNEHGAAGWELVAYDFDTGVGIFKRPDESDVWSTFDAYAKAIEEAIR